VGQDSRAAGCDPPQVGDAVLVDPQERIEYGRHEDGTAIVRLEGPSQRSRIGRLLPARGSELTKGIAERAASSRRAGELAGQLCQKAVGPQIAAGTLDLIEQQTGQRK